MVRTDRVQRVSIAFFVAALCALATPLWSQQSTTGSFHGTLTDASGAVVPNATVRAEQIGTGLSRESKTSATGDYEIPSLPPGNYRITVTAPGFKTLVQPIVPLLVNQDATVDFKVEVGASTQTVQVTGTPPALTTTPAAVGQVIGESQVNDLPLNGRQFTQLILLTPGASPHPSSQQASYTVTEGAGGVSPAVNGQRGQQNNYTLDGIPNNSLFENSWAISPPPDAIQEFKVQSQIVDGQLNMSSGANVNVAIKTGSNQLHGDAWEFLRNSALDARNFFDLYSDERLPPYRQNQYGATLGGPVILPGYDGRKKHTYFFGYWEGFRSVEGISQYSSVPTAAVRGGDFSAFLGPVIGQDALGRNVQQGEVYDPFTLRQVTAGVTDPSTGLIATQTGLVDDPFPGNVIPPGRLRPETLANLAHFYPLPNLPGETVNLLLANDEIVSNDQFGIKGDHIFHNNDMLNVAFYRSKPNQLSPTGLPADPAPDVNTTDSVGIGFTHLFDPTLLLSLRYGYTYSDWLFGLGSTESASFVDATTPTNFFPIKNNVPIGLYNLPLPTYSSAPQFYVPLGPQRSHSFTADLAKTTGRHELGAGFLAFHLHSFDDGWGATTVYLPYQTGGPGFVGTTGQTAASWLLGVPYEVSPFLGDTSADMTIHWIGGYLQDRWKASDKLTLQFALRYDFVSPPSWLNNEFSTFDWEQGTFRVTQPVPPLFPFANVRKSVFDPQFKHNFQPRFGFAYKVKSSTVVRGAFAVFADHSNNLIEGPQGPRVKWPWGVDLTILANQQLLEPASAACRVVNGSQTCGPDTLIYDMPNASTFYGPNSPPNTASAADPRMHTPYAMEYNLMVEHVFTPNTIFDIGYVGSQGRDLLAEMNVNTAPQAGTGPLSSRLPFPNLSPGITYANDVANSNYNSLQAKIERRTSKGLIFLGSYTYSKSLDQTSDAFSGEPDAYGLSKFYGRSDFDLRHMFTYSTLYQLPLGRGRTYLGGARGVTDAVLGGWDIGAIVTLQTGLPFTVGVTGDPANVGDSNFQHAEQVGNPLPSGFKRTADEWFNTAAFAQPTFGTFGDSGRNILSYPGYNDVDFFASKDFRIREALTLEFRSEFFNILNHPILGSGYSGVGGEQTQTVATPTFGELLTASPAREIQFAMKLLW